jgi:hypothetical protein
MQNKIEVHGKTFCKDTVEVLTGKRGSTDVDKIMLPVLEAIDNPDELPFLLEEINSLKATEELRLALVRVQVGSELKMHEDLNLYQKRLYTAQTIEKLLFGELLLEGGKEKEEKGKKKGE